MLAAPRGDHAPKWTRLTDAPCVCSAMNCHPQQRRDVVGAGAPHDIGAVNLDRARAQVQLARDRLVAQPCRDRFQDAALARGQRRQPRLGVAVPVQRRPSRLPVAERRIDDPAHKPRVERRGQQVARTAAQDGARLGDAQLLGGNKDGHIGAPRDPFEQRRAANPPGLVPAKQQDGAAAIAFTLQPIIGAGKAPNDALTPDRQCAKAGRAFGRVRQDQMDMARSIGHLVLLSLSRACGQRRWFGDGAVPDGFDMHRCTGRDCAAGLRRGRCTMLTRPASACLALWIAALYAAPVAAERPPRYSEEDILNGTTIALASQELCGFRVDEKAIRALIAAKLPDVSPDLIALQLRGYARVLPRLDDEQRQRHCAETRALAKAAGWLR